MSIKEFLLARIAEEEAAAGGKPVVDLPVTRVHHPHSIEDVPGWVLPMTIETFAHDRLEAGSMEASFTPDPTRILAECAAKRKIVAECIPDHEDSMRNGDDTTELASVVLYSLAAVYSDHPDYRSEWSMS